AILLGRHEWRLLGEIEDLVFLAGGPGLVERRGFLAMGVASAAIVANFAWAKLMPGLGHIQNHAVLVQGLKREGNVGGNLGEETGVRVAIGIEELASGR